MQLTDISLGQKLRGPSGTVYVVVGISNTHSNKHAPHAVLESDHPMRKIDGTSGMLRADERVLLQFELCK